MVVFPRAKINIGLRIVEKRPDGFHNIETFFYPVPLADALEFVVRKDGRRTDTLKVTGVMEEDNPENNMVMRAVKLMRESFDFPWLKLHLHKAIPVGAGLGGGSSDAAGILRALNRYFGFGLNSEELRSFAGRLGSDAPFFIDNSPSFAEGMGNILSEAPLDLSTYYIEILYPDINSSTAEAYATCEPCPTGFSLRQLLTLPVSEWRGRVINDFELNIFMKYPLTGELKMSLYEAGAVYASLSGSGSAVYGIFREKPELSESLSKYLLATAQV
ncbi:MAG TPA: 4-(cytidine 5'-diphospho)-2-C-methyl-D-erythritol kinase [Bacteroidales bacterium]|nr:4-(cytidine 5'-diphospho)-2-C-methyl-D-erythritol kinase [Bacteroidales bacterium]